MLAARNGEIDYVKSLLAAGADKAAKDAFGRTPADLVNRFDYNREEMLTLLR